MRTKIMFAGIAVIAALAAVPALAQQPQRVRGTIESVDGSTLVIKQGEGPDVTRRSALVHIKINSANDGTKTAIAFCVQPITEPSSS